MCGAAGVVTLSQLISGNDAHPAADQGYMETKNICRWRQSLFLNEYQYILWSFSFVKLCKDTYFLLILLLRIFFFLFQRRFLIILFKKNNFRLDPFLRYDKNTFMRAMDIGQLLHVKEPSVVRISVRYCMLSNIYCMYIDIT